MEKKDYCGDCEVEFPESELHYADAGSQEWAKALGFQYEPKCEDCAEAAFDREQERLARGWV